MRVNGRSIVFGGGGAPLYSYTPAVFLDPREYVPEWAYVESESIEPGGWAKSVTSSPKNDDAPELALAVALDLYCAKRRAHQTRRLLCVLEELLRQIAFFSRLKLLDPDEWGFAWHD